MQLWSAKLGDLEQTLQEKKKCCKRKCLAGGIPAQLLHDRRTDFVWTKGEQVHRFKHLFVMLQANNFNKCVYSYNLHCSVTC